MVRSSDVPSREKVPHEQMLRNAHGHVADNSPRLYTGKTSIDRRMIKYDVHSHSIDSPGSKPSTAVQETINLRMLWSGK